MKTNGKGRWIDVIIIDYIGKMKTKLEKAFDVDLCPSDRIRISNVAASMIEEVGKTRFFLQADGSIKTIVKSVAPEHDTHELKILPKWFDDVREGRKNFEIRKADRDFKVGDYLILREWDRGKFTERFLTRQIEYIYQGDGSYGISEEYCILGIKIPEEESE